MQVAKLRHELAQCWLAKALVQVLERALKGKYVLVSMGDAAIASEGSILSELMNASLRRDATHSINLGYYVHVNSLDELQQWALVPCEKATSVLFIVYAPCEDTMAIEHVNGIIELTLPLQRSWDESLLLVLHNPNGLMGFENGKSRAKERLSMYHLGRLGTIEDTAIQTSVKFIAQPLDYLRDQCGWRFVLEIVRWIPEALEGATREETTFGAARTTAFSTIKQLPFQLVVLALRWSHFHPQLVRACARKLQRQRQLIPQRRIRRQLEELQRRESQLWSRLYPLAQVIEKRAHLKQEPPLSRLSRGVSWQSQVIPRKVTRLSQCCLWDTQKQFYKEQGIRAWSSGAIPFGVSSSSFLAAAYARTVMDFLVSYADDVNAKLCNQLPNCFVWEAASGSCKFLHSFMLHFTELVERDDELKRRGLVPVVIATDLSHQVLSSRCQMPCFRPFLERGQLDFALFDTQEFIHGNGSSKHKTLDLMHSRRQWHVGKDGPVALIGNYFLDSLRADVFTVATHQGQAPATNVHDVHDKESNEHVVVQIAELDETTSSIATMDIRLRPVADPRTQAIYEDERLNATLVQVLETFLSSAPASLTGLIIFPVEAFEFFLTLLDRDDMAKAFPIAILAGDARFSFRDAISSAFVVTSTTKAKDALDEDFAAKVSLELPQLSPHPDCFCLPVDFEIVKMFFEHLNCSVSKLSVCSELISTPASDTFDVFFAAIEPRLQKEALPPPSLTRTTKLQCISFKQQFANFTPGDCDLLWGMMSFDNGARSFSVDALLALLAQTGWDFDLFRVMHWELLHRVRKQEPIATSKYYQNLLIEAGKKCWRTFYHMEQQTETDSTTREIRLQLARWFYELEADDNVLEVLMPWCTKAHEDMTLKDAGICYLLGLANLRMNNLWNALSFFRLCARFDPSRLKFQRQVTRALLALQTWRFASTSSSESDGN